MRLIFDAHLDLGWCAVSFNRDLTLSVAYTYSHSIDNSSDRFDGAFVNSYDLATNRGSSNFDVRHNLAISYVYGLPFFKASGLSHTLEPPPARRS